MRQVGTSNNGPASNKSYRRGHWSVEEDHRLIQFVTKYGQGRWNKLAQAAGLQRCGKSCRLRWVNYLRPDIKRGRISDEEERVIINLHSVFGNRWSLIAIHLPGRSDNEIKNYWRSHIKKKFKLDEAPSHSNTSTSCLNDKTPTHVSEIEEQYYQLDKISQDSMQCPTSNQCQSMNYECSDGGGGAYYVHTSESNVRSIIESSLPSSANNNMPMQCGNLPPKHQTTVPEENRSMKLQSGHEWKSKYQSQAGGRPFVLGESGEALEHALLRQDATTYHGCDAVTNSRNLLSLQDADIPWDVETIQSIMEVQHSHYPVLDAHNIWES